MDHLNPREYLIIRGARTHNLKNISVAIPHNQLVVVAGLSGSGKSSLIVDTLFVEAQRRYIESLSTHARQFLGKMAKPAVDSIEGVRPAIAIQQGVVHKNPRSTVATVTELADYFYLLYARIGITYSPLSGQVVQKDSVTDVVDYLYQQEEGTKLLLLYPIACSNQEALLAQLSAAQGKGFTRVMQADQLFFIEEILLGTISLRLDQPLYGLVDRLVVRKQDPHSQRRAADSVQVAFTEGDGRIAVSVIGGGQRLFSDRFERDGMLFELPSVPFFNSNTPYGACKQCAGLGYVIDLAEEKVIPNSALSLAEGAVAPWQGPIMRKWLAPLSVQQKTFDLLLHTPYSALTADQKEIIWKGKGDFIGIEPFFEFCAKQTDKIHYRVLLSRYRSKKVCPLCQGSCMRVDTKYVRIGPYALGELLTLPLQQVLAFCTALPLTVWQASVAQRIVTEIKNRLHYLVSVGLGYVTLNRPIDTLSNGEYQRVRLATALGSPLCGVLYILDEPTAGLHPRDIHRLTQQLVHLKEQGNTVIVIEHEAQVMQVADRIIEIGPEAGIGGGNLVFEGNLSELLQSEATHTARYLKGSEQIPLPKQRRDWCHSLWIKQARLHNLKDVTVAFPLQLLTVVTGVSGSGKSSLVSGVLYPALVAHLAGASRSAGSKDTLVGDFHCIQAVEHMQHHALGKWARSNPLTYLGLYDYIRTCFAQTALARKRNYQRGHFSFYSAKGQCSSCRGEGIQKIEMQFMAAIELPCEVCQGNRFKPEILDVTYCGKNITQLLHMTVAEALVFFADHACLMQSFKALQAIGLAYIALGQSFRSLSAGERQRLKLAYYLAKETKDQSILFILDEPTTGLHLRDVHLLVMALHALVQRGHTVIVMEHHLDIISNADWVIDLGPGGGAEGGQVVFTGRPEALLQEADNVTAYHARHGRIHCVD
ncbi:UvrABC system protein A [Candidatus Cardinium hertigii]|uniref:UvrABC system protein A n=1 Tax=Candidatus Cardinium hertigii TaxID=247481 RepID=A0A2Z3LI45_9BACT|nr:UvrABC system protein A [Candidatus Cardinium hertigii]